MSVDIVLDIGTSKTVICARGKILLEQPSVVTVDSETFSPVYFGDDAKATIGRTHEALTTVKPIEHGIVSDYDIAVSMLSKYMVDCFGSKVIRPSVATSLPTGLTEMQHHTLTKVIEESGGRNVIILEGPLAVAIGLDIDFSSPKGNMIVDIGAGTTDISVISMGGLVQSHSDHIASDDFDDAIVKYVRRKHSIEIGYLTAEAIKKQIGTVVRRSVDITMIARGKNLLTGLPQSFEITSAELYETMFETAVLICNAVRKVIERTNPDIISDIMEKGIYLTGGGSLTNGMPQFMGEFLGTKIIPAQDPTHSVARGLSMAIKKPQLLKKATKQLRFIKDLIIE